jgi:hypothetical protein
MKKYIAAFVIMLVFLTASFIYKSYRSANVFKNFPFDIVEQNTEQKQFLIFLFFRKNICKSCLEIVDILNKLPEEFKVFGVVPESELENELELRRYTGVNFDLLSMKKFRKFQPFYLPTLIGVFAGKIYFVLPASSGTKDNIYNLLLSFYYAATPLFYNGP